MSTNQPITADSGVQFLTKELTPTLRAKDYGKTTILFVIKERTDLFAFRQIERDGKLLDEMWRRGKNDVEATSVGKESKA